MDAINLDLDDLDFETVAIIDAGIGSLDAGLSATTDITLLSDLFGGSLEAGLIAVGTAGGVVIANKLGLVEVFESRGAAAQPSRSSVFRSQLLPQSPSSVSVRWP